MITFTTTHTERFSFELQELNLKAIRHLCDIPVERIEEQRGIFLKYVLKTFTPSAKHKGITIDDLTVEERLFIEATYLSHVADEGDFLLGSGRYSDYLQFEKQYKHQATRLGILSDDGDDENETWHLKPLLGAEAERIEALILAKESYSSIDWLLYSMACRLYREKDEKAPSAKDEPLAFEAYVEEKVKTLELLPETVALELINLFLEGAETMTHLFSIWADDDGFCVRPNKETKEGDEVVLHHARFQPFDSIHPLAKALIGKY